MKSKSLGVVVVRLQVPELHGGHRYLLNTVTAIHENVLVVIGETEARLSPEDPLTYEMREAMLKKMYPKVITARLKDQPSDDLWSQELDALILRTIMDTTPAMEPVLYGGRDSFLKHYTGRCRSFELPPVEPVSGTEVRAAVEPKDSEDFRAGMIYAAKHKFPTSYQCVDVAIRAKNRILLGQKPTDNGRWRFIGGFVSPVDATLEHAAGREVKEEVNLFGSFKYIGSAQIDDHRYPSSGTDRLMTALFLMDNPIGALAPGDDITDCKWFDQNLLYQVLIPEHQVLNRILQAHFVKESMNVR